MVGSDGALAPGAGDLEAGVGKNDDGEDDGDGESDVGLICVLVVVLVIVTDIHTVLLDADWGWPRARRGQPIDSCWQGSILQQPL